MQNKMAAKSQLDVQNRICKAVCNLERRQDHGASVPQDFLRHYRACDNKLERQLLLAAATHRHMQAGICCLPSCMVWLWSLRVASKAMRIWARQPGRPEPGTTETTDSPGGPRGQPNPELGEWTLDQWEVWMEEQREKARAARAAEAGSAAGPGEASSSSGRSPEATGM